jgi:hypothetical protein
MLVTLDPNTFTPVNDVRYELAVSVQVLVPSSDTAALLAVRAASMAPVQAEPFVSFRVAVLILSTMTLPLSF